MKTRLLLSIVAACFMMISCEGPQGPEGGKGDTGLTGATGPMGVTGPSGSALTGAPGPSGATGEKGEKGDAGTSNIIYSAWVTPNVSNWQKVSDINYTYTITESKIAQEIVDKGVVLAYGRQSAGTTSYLLPLTLTNNSSISNYNVGISLGKVIFNFLELLEPSGKPASNMQFRYVIIPGGVQARANIDYTDFDAVAKAFGIPE